MIVAKDDCREYLQKTEMQPWPSIPLKRLSLRSEIHVDWCTCLCERSTQYKHH